MKITIMKKLAIFDLDGTLFDTLDDITSAGNYALDIMGFPTYDKNSYKNFIGQGLKHTCAAALGKNTSEENIDRMIELYKKYYSENKVDDAKLFVGVLDVLDELKANGITLAVATNKSDTLAKTIVERIAGEAFFSYICGSNEEIYKPDPSVIMKILEATGLKKHEAVMIGDSEIDLLTAKNSGIQSVFCAWGYGERNCKTKADYYIEKPTELINIFEI
ncbi:haloacid dehalogenase [Clostridia bacterium]|nr:haloacid dehalogenase [Clostridia bacterium]